MIRSFYCDPVWSISQTGVTPSVFFIEEWVFDASDVSSISRPQKRDQTEKYNENILDFLPKFDFSKSNFLFPTFFKKSEKSIVALSTFFYEI